MMPTRIKKHLKHNNPPFVLGSDSVEQFARANSHGRPLLGGSSRSDGGSADWWAPADGMGSPLVRPVYCCRYWLLVAGYWLLVTGYWLLATGYWLLVTGHWLLATGYWLLATGASPHGGSQRSSTARIPNGRIIS